MAVLRQSPDQKENVSFSGSELQGKRNRALLNHSRASSSARSDDAEKSGQYYRFNPLPYKGVAVRLYLRTACGSTAIKGRSPTSGFLPVSSRVLNS